MINMSIYSLSLKQVGTRPGGRYDMRPYTDNYRLQTITKTTHFRWWNVFDNVCRMGRWVDANRSTFDEDMRVYIFVPSDLDLWALDLKFASLVTLVQRYVFTKLEVSTAFLFRENRIHGTDGRTDGRDATLNVALLRSWEGSIITYIGKSNSISITNIILT